MTFSISAGNQLKVAKLICIQFMSGPDNLAVGIEWGESNIFLFNIDPAQFHGPLS